jgi:hypothetical protein
MIEKKNLKKFDYQVMDLKYVKETKDVKIISWPSVSNLFSFKRWRTMIGIVLGLPNPKL